MHIGGNRRWVPWWVWDCWQTMSGIMLPFIISSVFNRRQWNTCFIFQKMGPLPGLPFRQRRVKKWPWFFLRRRIALCSLKRMPVLVEYHVIDFRQIHWLRGKIPLTCCREQKAAFLSGGSVNVAVLLPLWEINNYLGRNVSSRGLRWKTSRFPLYISWYNMSHQHINENEMKLHFHRPGLSVGCQKFKVTRASHITVNWQLSKWNMWRPLSDHQQRGLKYTRSDISLR